MSDIRLFRYCERGVSELLGKSVAIEKKMQTLIESQMESFLGVRFLASEYNTGPSIGEGSTPLGSMKTVAR